MPLDASGYNKAGRSLQSTFWDDGMQRLSAAALVAAHDVAAEAWAKASALIAVVGSQRRPHRAYLGAEAGTGRQELALGLNRAVRPLAGSLHSRDGAQRQ